MNTPLSWIKQYVPDLDCRPQEYADAMTLSGTKVETYHAFDADLDKIVVGRVLSVEPHPDADKLVVCRVDVGSEQIQIVTGAPNVSEGMLTPVVLSGGRVAGGHDGKPVEGGVEIKAGPLRGVESQGMMCSIQELGSSHDFYPEAPEDGLYVFEEGSVSAGDDAIEALGLHDVNFEYEVTSNRVDCYSVLGIAREAAATFRKEFHPPQVPETGNGESAADYIRVRVEDPELCPRFCARVVKNVKIGPSPAWMRQALAKSGIRPINNLVDITNYVMEEYGQPMHAYDLDTIEGGEIVVRRAKEGEKFVTLDGQERALDPDVLMICDGRKPIGMAGIMGGENTMITEGAKNLLFEAANFNGTNVRLSAKRVGLRTEASGKFEKGLDPNNAKAAIDRACALIEELGAGEVVGGIVDVYPQPKEEERVPFEPEKINALLGTELTEQEMLEYLALADLHLAEGTRELVIPTFRQDLHRTCDIAEEVVRFYGYDRVGTTLPTGEATTGGISYEARVLEKAKQAVEHCGFSEGMCFSFESPKVFDRLRLSEDDPARRAIRIQNPLGEDFSIMRTLSVHGMLNSLALNHSHRNKQVRLYETGNIYLPGELPVKELPDERRQLTLGMAGAGDFFDMKGAVLEVFERLGLPAEIEFRNEGTIPYLHPGRQACVFAGENRIAYLGEVHPEVARSYGVGESAYLAVIDMPQVTELANFDRKYAGVARFPAVTRDLSMVVPKAVTAGEIEKMIRQRGGNILESLALFDLYEGEQVKEGHKSMAYSLVFRSSEKTLEEAEISSAMKKILNGLEGMGIELRQ